MPLTKMEHYLVLTDDMEATRDFYVHALGMAVGPRPPLEFPGYWCYVGETPCIHIAEWASYAVWTKQVGIPVSSRAVGTGPVDHIAFNASGFDEMRERLRARGLAPAENLLDEIGLRQLFFYDPNGVPIELNFRS